MDFQMSDGMNYAPVGKPSPVVGENEFIFAAIGLDHGHIYGMCNGLREAGATLRWVYDPDQVKVDAFLRRYPGVKAARCEEEILSDPDVRLIAGAAVTSERCAVGLRAMDAGKDYFTDKAPMTTLAQLASARAKAAETGRKYMVYYGERLHSEAAVYAGQLVRAGAVGRVIQVLGLGPHRLNAPSRPDWFFKKEKYGGILCDIGSHQIEQFLYYANETEARVVRSQIGNFAHPEYPELDDFGDAVLVGGSGATQYFRVDWFTPDGLRTWGDGRTVILGTDGYIELRKYINIGTDDGGDQVFLVDGKGEHRFAARGRVGCPFFGELILDCINRTENAMTQAHAFLAAELCLTAQANAVDLTSR